MRKRMLRLRLAVALFAVAVIGGAENAEADGCPGNIVIGGSVACHNTAGTNCNRCRYLCDDGYYYTWNMCAVE